MVIGASDQALAIRSAISAAKTSMRLAVAAEAGRLTPAVLAALAGLDAAVIVAPRASGFSAEVRRECLLAWAVGVDTILAVESNGPRDAQEVRETGAAFAAWAWQVGGRKLEWAELAPGGARLVSALSAFEASARPAEPFRLWVTQMEQHLESYRVTGRRVGMLPAAGATLAVLPGGDVATVASSTVDGDGVATLEIAGRTAPRPGALLAAPDQRPEQSDQIAAHLVWLSDKPLLPGRPYEIRLGPQRATAQVSTLKHRLNPLDLDPIAARQLAQGEVGMANLSFSSLLLSDPFERSRSLGRFTLHDPASGDLVAIGRIAFTLRRATNIHWQALSIDKAARASLKGQRPCCLWLTGLSGSGKSTVASRLEKALNAQGRHTYTLDGDNVRHGLNRDLGFTDADRVENIRRVGEVAKLFVDAGLIVIVSFISPFRAERQMARDLLDAGEFLEVFVDTPIALCEQRDPKGLYRKARAGTLKNFTGIDSPYEAPQKPDVHLKGGEATPDEMVATILGELSRRGMI